jgi:hypothetical protein
MSALRSVASLVSVCKLSGCDHEHPKETPMRLRGYAWAGVRASNLKADANFFVNPYALAGSAAADALLSCSFTILLRAARSFRKVFASL